MLFIDTHSSLLRPLGLQGWDPSVLGRQEFPGLSERHFPNIPLPESGHGVVRALECLHARQWG